MTHDKIFLIAALEFRKCKATSLKVRTKQFGTWIAEPIRAKSSSAVPTSPPPSAAPPTLKVFVVSGNAPHAISIRHEENASEIRGLHAKTIRQQNYRKNRIIAASLWHFGDPRMPVNPSFGRGEASSSLPT